MRRLIILIVLLCGPQMTFGQRPFFLSGCGVLPDTDKPGGPFVSSTSEVECTGFSVSETAYRPPQHIHRATDESMLLVGDFLSDGISVFSHRHYVATPATSVTPSDELKLLMKEFKEAGGIRPSLFMLSTRVAPANSVVAKIPSIGTVSLQDCHQSIWDHEAREILSQSASASHTFEEQIIEYQNKSAYHGCSRSWFSARWISLPPLPRVVRSEVPHNPVRDVRRWAPPVPDYLRKRSWA